MRLGDCDSRLATSYQKGNMSLKFLEDKEREEAEKKPSEEEAQVLNKQELLDIKLDKIRQMSLELEEHKKVRERQEQIRKEQERADSIYKMILIAFLAFEAVVLACFGLLGFITGFKGILWALAFLTLSAFCAEKRGASETLILHGLFLWVKIMLSRHMFEQDLWWVVLSVLIMTAVNIAIRILLNYLIKKYDMYWRGPMGMG